VILKHLTAQLRSSLLTILLTTDVFCCTRSKLSSYAGSGIQMIKNPRRVSILSYALISSFFPSHSASVRPFFNLIPSVAIEEDLMNNL